MRTGARAASAAAKHGQGEPADGDAIPAAILDMEMLRRGRDETERSQRAPYEDG